MYVPFPPHVFVVTASAAPFQAGLCAACVMDYRSAGAELTGVQADKGQSYVTVIPVEYARRMPAGHGFLDDRYSRSENRGRERKGKREREREREREERR